MNTHKKGRNGDNAAKRNSTSAARKTAVQKDSELSPAQEALMRLTPKERQVFDRLVLGKTIQQIAEELGNAHSTVNTHCANIYRKLMVTNRVQLVREYCMNEKDTVKI